MGYKYEFKRNSINDFFIETLLNYNDDIAKKAPKNEIKHLLNKFILDYVDESEIQYFDFDIKKTKYGTKVVANNFGTALFFNNIIPSSFTVINSQEELVFNDNIYSFDKNKKLLIIKKNNGQIKRT